MVFFLALKLEVIVPQKLGTGIGKTFHKCYRSVLFFIIFSDKEFKLEARVLSVVGKSVTAWFATVFVSVLFVARTLARAAQSRSPGT